MLDFSKTLQNINNALLQLNNAKEEVEKLKNAYEKSINKKTYKGVVRVSSFEDQLLLAGGVDTLVYKKLREQPEFKNKHIVLTSAINYLGAFKVEFYTHD